MATPVEADMFTRLSNLYRAMHFLGSNESEKTAFQGIARTLYAC